MELPTFDRYIGIDYSGAETADSSCRGLRVYVAEGSGRPKQILIPIPPQQYWTRRGLAEWLRKELEAGVPTIVGIDHGFSFPLKYFERHSPGPDWPSFLVDFQKHWPTDEPKTYIDFIRDGIVGEGSKRMGENTWLRLTEKWTATAKSVFLFDVQGSVAKSTFAGLPWLLYLLNSRKRPVHFWPFEGWDIPQGASVVAEVYPALWMRRFERDGRDGDEHAAFATAAWLQRADRDRTLGIYLSPPLTTEEQEIAEIEGWILGVV
jgi:hypothetical protein